MTTIKLTAGGEEHSLEMLCVHLNALGSWVFAVRPENLIDLFGWLKERGIENDFAQSSPLFANLAGDESA